MNKVFFLFLSIPLIGVACSSDSSSSSEKTEGASTAFESSSSSDNKLSVSYGIIPIDTTIADGSSQDINDNNINVTSSSKTEFHFHSEKTFLFESTHANKFLSAYYNEQGLQYTGSDYNGGYMVTYRTLSDEVHKYAGWLWNNAYSHSNGACESDLELFKNECLNRNGEFVNYREEDACTVRQLWLSCVYPLNTDIVDKAFIDSVAAELYSFAEEHWSTPLQEKTPSSSMSASSTSP